MSPRRTAAGPALVGVCAIVGLSGVIRATRPLLNGPDPFWHWDLGRRIVTNQSLPTTDPYSFLTEGREWALNQWGTDLIIGLVTELGGLQLLALVTAIAVAVGTGLTAREMWQRAPSLVTVPLLALVMLTAMSSWVLRGTLATLILLPLALRELHREETRPWAIGLLLLLWANLHAAFVIGMALVVTDGVGRIIKSEGEQRRCAVRRVGLSLGASLVAVMVTPYGPRYVVEIASLAASGPKTGISEWAPPAILELRFLPLTILVVLVIVGTAISARRDDLPQVLMIVAGTLVGLTAQRNAALGAVIVGVTGAPYVLRALADLRRREAAQVGSVGRFDRGLAAMLIVLSSMAAVAVTPRMGTVAAHAEGVPLSLIQQLDDLDRPARVAVSATWAPAVAALTGDHVRTEVDGRAELFDATARAQHLQLHRGAPDWEQALNEWCVTDALVPTNAPLARLLAAHDDWEIAQADDLSGADGSAMWFTDAKTGSCP